VSFLNPLKNLRNGDFDLKIFSHNSRFVIFVFPETRASFFNSYLFIRMHDFMVVSLGREGGIC
tara:strand:- start:743 stop:931 length:189 start_codon:yes stop_codon:yes gene_type:complete